MLVIVIISYSRLLENWQIKKMRVVILLILIAVVNIARGQTVLDWSDLSEGISWEKSSPEPYFPVFQKANFSPKIRALEGEQVIITGYLLVLDGKQSVYLLSKNPMASCFFCGNGGPETIVDLWFAQKPSFTMDALVSVEGVLRLNEHNPNASYYRIEEADATSFK